MKMLYSKAMLNECVMISCIVHYLE